MDFFTSKLGSNTGSSFGSFGSAINAANNVDAFPYKWFIIGVIVAVLIVVVLFYVIPRAETRPIKQGFYGGPINGSSSLACGRMSSEAEELVDIFASRPLDVGEEGQMDLHDLKAVLSKMLCMKQDLMAPQQTITAAKELGFATHMDIQPVADLTARCFNKSVPERDLSIQFEKWREFGLDIISRLCTAGKLSDSHFQKAEALFTKTWKDALDVALTQCIKSPTNDKLSSHDAAPRTPENVMNLREYDGYY